MRVTKIAGDFHDIGDRPCRVWCNEQEITDWTVADDFRRVVETPGGVHHGAVRIDLAPEVPELALVSADLPIVYGRFMRPDGVMVTGTMQHFDVALPEEMPKDIQWSGEIKKFDVAQPVEKATKPNIHIPARKRKAGK